MPVGEKFGRLTVLRRTTNSPRGDPCWRVRCECSGVEKVVLAANVRDGHTRSCGCLVAEQLRDFGWTSWRKGERVAVAGAVFGHLTLIEQVSAGVNPKWLVQCRCGSRFVAHAGQAAKQHRDSKGAYPRCRRCSYDAKKTHGMGNSPEAGRWRIWRFHKKPMVKAWRDDFAVLFAAMGAAPEGQPYLLRPDQSKPLGPGNAEWSAFEDNPMTFWVTFRGVRAPMARWARWMGVERETIRLRVKRGEPVTAWLFRPGALGRRQKSA